MRRKVALAAGAAVVLLLALRVALAFYAADLFVAVVRQAASGGGIDVVFGEAPSVTLGGFEARGVSLRSADGREWLRSSTVSGTMDFLFGSPWAAVALSLAEAKIDLSAAATNDGGGSGELLPALPANLSKVHFDAARIDLGGGSIVTLTGDVEAEGRGGLRVAASRLDYSEESEERAAEKLSGTFATTIVLPTEVGGLPSTRIELVAGSGAALIGSVLLDFAAHPLSVKAVLQPSEKRGLHATDVDAALGKLVRATGRLDFAADRQVQAGDVTIASDDLMPAFETLVREPFAGVTPALAGSSLEGKGRVRLQFGAPSRHRAELEIDMDVKSLRTRSLEADSLAINLPWAGNGVSSRGARAGRVRAAKLSLLGIPWSGADAPVSAAPGRLRVNDQQWKSLGGVLRISDVVFEDDAKDGPRMAANLALDGFDLSQVGDVLGWTGLAGTLGGELGRVRVDSESLRAEGGVRLETFGGSIALSKLTIEEPFGRVPELGLDVRVDAIDLGALTSSFGVGRIDGVLEGSVTGLVLADGQPQSFDADLHTIERRGVPQTVDVRAIRQLGVLGGGDSGSLTGSLLNVIDRYRYSKLGVRCRLRNDIFEIRGVETSGDKDYIVKGSLLPPSVSVVSHSQVVSFSEMLRRIQTITAIGEGGPSNAASP